MQESKFSKVARRVTDWSGSAYATMFAFLTVILWVVGGLIWFGFGDFYQILINTFTTIVTFLMVFLIQHTQNHDTKAMHMKMDELIMSNRKADNRLINIEELTEEQLSALHETYKSIGEKTRQRDLDAEMAAKSPS